MLCRYTYDFRRRHRYRLPTIVMIRSMSTEIVKRKRERDKNVEDADDRDDSIRIDPIPKKVRTVTNVDGNRERDKH